MVDYFEVVLSSKNNPNVSLKLPATPYTLLDTMSKLQLEEGEVPTWIPFIPESYNNCFSYDSFAEFRELYTCIARKGSIFELNALIEKVDKMDDGQRTAFAGLMLMESGEDRAEIPLPRLIDLAYNTDACEVFNALDDHQLGKSRVENGSVPHVRDLPADLVDLLDLAQVGKSIRTHEGGAFVEHTKGHRGGYVVRHDLKPVYQDLDLAPKKPDHEILLRLYSRWSNEQTRGKAIHLKLPADQDTVSTALGELGAADWDGVIWTCLDCRAPSLIEIINNKQDPHKTISLAEKLNTITDSQLIVYQALLEDRDCKQLNSALELADVLPHYTISRQLHDPKEVAEAYLSQFLPEQELEYIQPYLDWSLFGQILMDDHNSALTGYGLIEEIDPPLLSNEPEKEGPQMGGMDLA